MNADQPSPALTEAREIVGKCPAIAAAELPAELPDWLKQEFAGRLSEADYRQMRAEHFASEADITAHHAGGSWIRCAAIWLSLSEDNDPPYGSRHHVNGILARALFAEADRSDLAVSLLRTVVAEETVEFATAAFHAEEFRQFEDYSTDAIATESCIRAVLTALLERAREGT